MNCRGAQEFLNGYLDHELDPVHSAEIEAHCFDCPDCSAAHDSLQGLRKRMEDQTLYFRAPEGLAARIHSSLPQATPAVRKPLYRPLWLRLLPVAAVACALVVIGLLVGRRLSPPSGETLVADEIISAHVRSLQPGHLMDVPSSDQHTVKPWFDGKLDFSPPVPDLAQEGFPLLGGRLDYFAGRPAAALIYQRRKHFINVFVQLASALHKTGQTSFARNGYNVVRWEQNGMTLWAVSDVSARDLEEFVRLFQGH